MNAPADQNIRLAHRRLAGLNRQMALLLRDIAMEDSTCDSYRELGKELRIISASIDMALGSCNELSRVPDRPRTVQFLVCVPGSEQARAERNFMAPDFEGPEQPESEHMDENNAEGMESPSLEELAELLSLIQRVSDVARARCDYFNRRPTGFFSSLTAASASVVRERRYIWKLQPTAETNVEFLKQEGPIPELPVDPDRSRISGGGMGYGRKSEDE